MTTHFHKTTGHLYTYCTTGQGDEMLFQVALPNGRKLDLDSKQGADEFVDIFGTAFISMSLTATDDQELKLAYRLMLAVAANAFPEKIASGIPESELHALIEHTRDTLDTLSTGRNWLRSGTVSTRHEQLLSAVVCFSKHPSFVKIFISDEGMEAVAKFYASRKKNVKPNNCVAKLIVTLVINACHALTQQGLSFEKVFGTMEKTGLLGQFIRCVAVDPDFSAFIMKYLQTCSQLVKKKLRTGTPTGDILNAVIAGKDGPINERIKSSLARLQSLALLSNCSDECDDVIKRCHHCEKLESQMDGTLLMKCSRCKVTYYCSKDCQVIDWKIHKKMCKVLGSGIVSRSKFKTAQNTASAFLTSNYFEIAKEVYKKTKEFNVSKKELLLEVDFFGDAPALRNEFKVWLSSGFLEGGSSIANSPDLFRTHAEKTSFERLLREGYDDDDLPVVCRASYGLVVVSRLNRPGAETDYQAFSDEAVESIGSEDNDRMVAYLG
jgi:phage FluMu protein Com